MKVRCRKLRVIPKRVLQKYLRPERCHNFLAADMIHDVVEVPVEEAVSIRVVVGNFVPEAGFWEEECQCWFWDGALWVDAAEYEEKLCPILAYDDGTVEDTVESG